MVGREEEAFQYLALVNKWSFQKTTWYLGQVSAIFRACSQITDWQLDLSWVEKKFGIVIKGR